MFTKAVRLYGKNDLRLEEFELPQMKDDEILANVVCDSICMSSYKAIKQGADHKRVPADIATNPTIIGHEFSGEILEVGNKWKNRFEARMKFSIQPAMNYPDGPVGLLSAPGYSYEYIGGDITKIIIPNEVMESGCLLPYYGKGLYPAALSEPVSCVIGAMHASYHTIPGSYFHSMDIIDGGNMAILGGVGPMGLAAINYTIHRSNRKPKLLVVTDIDQQRIDRASKLYSPEKAAKKGIELKYINTNSKFNPDSSGQNSKILLDLTNGKGYVDVFVFTPVKEVIKTGDEILAFDGCLNFFAGPDDANFNADVNFYNIHYNRTHIIGTSGGNTDDMKEALKMMSEEFDPAGLISHIGGLDSVIQTTYNLPDIPGGKKLIYTNISLELTSIADFEIKGKSDKLFKRLSEIIKANNYLWCTEAEEFLLLNAKKI